MFPLSVLGISIAVQITAAVLALLLIRRTGWMTAWLLIACGLGLMAIRRLTTFFSVLSGAGDLHPEAEIIALLISLLMLVGIILIKPRFEAMKSTKDLLRESEATYRGIVDNMLETFYRTDLTGRLIMISPAAEKLIGYSQQELTGMSVEQLYLDPADHDRFIAALDKGGGQTRDYSIHLRHKQGHKITIESNSRYLMNASGDVIGVEGVVRDITNRLRREQLTTRLGRIVEDSLNEIYIFDAESLRFILVNRGARENLGYSVEELQAFN